MTAHTVEPSVKFATGRIVATPGALTACPTRYLTECLKLHLQGDWGCIAPEDREANDEALREGSRILSAYPIDPSQESAGHGSHTLWIITEADRSVTTFLLPDEY